MINKSEFFETFNFQTMSWQEVPIKIYGPDSYDFLYFFSFRRALGALQLGDTEFLIFGGSRKLQRLNTSCIISILPDSIDFR